MAGSDSARFPVFEKRLKKSLRRPVVADTYNPSTTEAKAGRVLPSKFPNYEKELKKA